MAARGNGIPQDKVILEIGPGLNFGSALYLTCFGARALVVDPFLAPWDAEYHPGLYTMMRDTILQETPQQDITPFNIILNHNGYDPDIIKPVRTSLEDLKGISTSSVDMIFSNAVLEHLYDPLHAFRSLARVSKPGCTGFHQVDFRDHRNFDMPLEFLLLRDGEFANLGKERDFECGNRWRSFEYTILFERVGFQVIDISGKLHTEVSYLQEFIPRLRAAKGSKYQNCNENDLAIIGAFYKVEKKAYRGFISLLAKR